MMNRAKTSPLKKSTKKKLLRVILSVVMSIALALVVLSYILLGPLRVFFWNMPYLTGFFGPVDYLVLIQNDSELRPTGGFITAVAEVRMIFGIPSIDVFDVYQIPDPKPALPAPTAFGELIGKNDPFYAGWTVRDANFSPDFATSSRDILDLYRLAYPDKSFEMVVSVDFAVAEQLIEAYGPVEISDLSITSENFFELTQRMSKDIDTHDTSQLSERKNILGPFAQELLKSVISTPTQYGQLTRTLHELAQQKHILAYSTSASFQEKLSAQGYTQVMKNENPDDDFLHVNIANIGGRKADRYVTKSTTYRADFSDAENNFSKLDIHLEHLGSYNIQSDIYQAYVRSYVPRGSLLLSSRGGLSRSEVTEDLGFSVFSDYVRLRPGESLTLSYTYRLPENLRSSDYRLHIITQPGVQNDSWRIAMRQPNDTDVIQLSGPKMSVKENIAIWDGDLQTDTRFELGVESDTSPPIILWQEFESLNRINVRFNEQLDLTFAEDPRNFRIVDLNKTSTETDEITVTKSEFSGRDLWLTVIGATSQLEEHYELSISDMRDLAGNVTLPNPVIRTLVQRLSD